MSYRVQFQAFDSFLAVVGETSDLAFARQIMLAAYPKLCTPGQQHPFIPEHGRTRPVYQPVDEPVLALYEVDGASQTLLDSIGWTEEGGK